MTKQATAIRLTAKERETLKEWVESAVVQQGLAERARIVLLAAEGRTTQEIAMALDTRPARVSKWRTRFATQGLAGLANSVRTGKPRQYDETTEVRILRVVGQRPPLGRLTWTGALVAQALGDVSADEVWRVLRKRGIRLARRRGQDLDCQAEFGATQVDLVGIYLHEAASAVAISAAVSRAANPGGFIRLPDSRLAGSFRHGTEGRMTNTLVEALEIATALAHAGRFVGPGRPGLERFSDEIAAQVRPDAVHLLFAAENRVRPTFPGLAYHPAASHAEWIKQVECWFAVLRRPLAGADAAQRLIRAIERFISASKERETAAFEWRSRASSSGTPLCRESGQVSGV